MNILKVNCVLFSPSGNQVLTGGSDFSIQLFDLKTGTLITLESLLKSEGKKSLNLIGQKAIQKLINHPAIEGKDFELTDNFTVNPYGLLFVYRRGEIGGSYADAPFDVFIPYSDLKQLLKSETILSNYLKNLKNA